MKRLLLQRLLWAIPSLLVVSFLVFAMMDLAPGDAAATIAGEGASLEQIEQVRERLGLDDPVLVRYVDWVTDAARGDMQTSLRTNEPVVDLVMRALPRTMSLAVVSFAFAAMIALVAGCLAAARPNGAIDRIVTLGAALGITVPSFWLALILISQFAIQRSWFPALGYVPLTENPYEWLRHLVLPAIALSTITAGELARQLRGALRDAMSRDYVLTARAKGLPGYVVLGKHALKNAAIPVVTVGGLRFSQLLGGAVIVEQIFVLRGIGQLTIGAALGRDIPVVLGVVVVATVVVLSVNLLVDLSYGYFNPRLRR